MFGVVRGGSHARDGFVDKRRNVVIGDGLAGGYNDGSLRRLEGFGRRHVDQGAARYHNDTDSQMILPADKNRRSSVDRLSRAEGARVDRSLLQPEAQFIACRWP